MVLPVLRQVQYQAAAGKVYPHQQGVPLWRSSHHGGWHLPRLARTQLPTAHGVANWRTSAAVYLCSIVCKASDSQPHRVSGAVPRLDGARLRSYGQTYEARRKARPFGLTLLGRDLSRRFQSHKKSRANQVTLAHRDPSQLLCVYIASSDLAWAYIIAQLPLLDVNRLQNEQRHPPPFFLSGRFDKTKLSCSVV